MEIHSFHINFFLLPRCSIKCFKCSIFTVLQIPNQGHFTGSKKIQNDPLQYYSPYKVLTQSIRDFCSKLSGSDLV